MKNSLKLGFVLGLAATSVFAGCSSGSDDVNGGAGAPSAGRSGAATAGAPTAGAPAGGASNGGGGASNGGASAGSGGAKAGAGGGSSAGAGGSSAGAGGAAGSGGSAAGAGGSSAGAGGSAAGAGGAATCADENTGLPTGAAGAGSATTAVVLIDNVVVKKGAATAVEWQFANGTTIVDAAAGDTPTADKWSRSNYGYTVSGSAGAANTFLACAGSPAAGSLKNIVPFTAIDQQYEVRVPFAAADFSGATITASLKLVGGGRPDATCPVKAWIYIVNNVGGTQSDANVIPLELGKWKAATLTVPATGFDKVGLLGLRLTTFACQ